MTGRFIVIPSEVDVLEIRSAGRADLEFLVQGNLAMARETEGIGLDDATLREGIGAILDARQPGRYWVATEDGSPAGQMMVTYEWSDWRNRIVWWIQSVYVVPSARRRGVFRALYAYARHEAAAAGAGGLRLYVDATNTRAQAVYRELGMNGDHYRVFEDMFR
jgi:ribosomal protein S18 acetylase RimI-like enzyme